MIRENLFLTALTLLLISILVQSGCTSFETIELPKDYKFESKNVITVYVNPTGVEDLDETYARVMCLDFQCRGYKAINANEELRKNGDSLVWTNHREIADIIMNKPYLANSDIIVVVKPSWKKIDFVTAIDERQTAAGRVYEGTGFRVWNLKTETVFYDRDLRSPILSYQASDTTNLMMDEKTKLNYSEMPWMLIARQLSSNLSQIKICSNDNSPAVDKIFPVSLWVDKSYRDAFPNNWADRLQLRMLYVNDILRRQFGVALEIKEIKKWDQSFTSSLKYMLEKLHMINNPDGSIRIGITLDEKLKALSVDRAYLGLAFPLQKDAIISAQPTFPGLQLWAPIQEAITMAHEISHLFGCVHVTDPNSIMYPMERDLNDKFDDDNLKIARHMKKYYMESDKSDLLKEYARELIQIKNDSPENTFQILGPIAAAFTNLFSQQQLWYEDSGKLERDLCKIIPDTCYALAAAGCVRYSSENVTEAAEFLRRALEIRPDFAEAHWYLGSALEKMGKKEEAEEHFAKTKPYSKYWVIDKSI